MSKAETFFYSIDFVVINGYDKDNVMQISTVVLDVKNSAKNWEKAFCFWDNCIWIGIVKLSLLRRGCFSSAANVLTRSPKILACLKLRLFPTQLTWQWSMNMIKVRWGRFQQCFRTFTMLLDERSSETGLFRHLSQHLFEVHNFGNTKSIRVIFFFKIFKIYCKI